MKLRFQLLFFFIALLLTFLALFTWLYFFVDQSGKRIHNVLWELEILGLRPDGLFSAFIGGLVFPILSIIIYFMLWKTNFFSRNKQSNTR